MATDWVPAATAGIGAAAAIGGQMVSGLFQGRNAKRAEERQRRQRVAETLAQVRAWITDAFPEILGIVAVDSTKRLGTTLTDLLGRRQQIRMALLTMGVEHPSERVRDLSQQLDAAMAMTMGSTSMYLSFLLKDDDREDLQATARSNYEEAQRLAEELTKEIRQL
jgi:F0F1-type ATP synthase membrane subunit c/vacuolar-type H+-ATPase subunit K